MTKPTPPHEIEEQTDPTLWGRFYTIVLAELAVLILLFYLFTKTFE